MKPLHALALDWAVRCFGHEHVGNRRVRSLRIAEEAVELAQSVGVEKQTMLELVNVVYGRPLGVPSKEAGSVLLTTVIFCAANDLDPDEAFAAELRRVLASPPSVHAQRNNDKNALGLSG